MLSTKLVVGWQDYIHMESLLSYKEKSYNYIYVTEYWKTDHVRTFGQLLFIGPANSHTHTLPVHCCINGQS